MSLVVPLTLGLALGLLLGLLGGGGGIIAVPLLLALGMPFESAATAALVVVGIGAAAGLVTHGRSGRVDWRLGITFGLLGAAGAVGGARVALAVDDRIQLAGFVVLLLVAAWGMLRRRTGADDRDPDAPIPTPQWGRVLLYASGVGLVTGFFGVGGGFIAVPALVLALRLPMRRASATGLVVILVNVTIAFLARGTTQLDTGLTAVVAGAAAAGAVLGALAQTRVSSRLLERGFGILLLAAAAYEAAVVLTTA